MNRSASVVSTSRKGSAFNALSSKRLARLAAAFSSALAVYPHHRQAKLLWERRFIDMLQMDMEPPEGAPFMELTERPEELSPGLTPELKELVKQAAKMSGAVTNREKVLE